MKYFLLYFFLEILVSVKISSYLGGLMTFAEIVGSAFVGMAILSNFKNSLIENLKAVSHNCMTLQEFQKLNLFTFIGAILIIMPGFLSDIIGSVMQFSVFTTMLVNRYSTGNKSCSNDFNATPQDNNIIDVEIVEDVSSIKK